MVLFAHGSGSSRHSPRNREVAGALHGFRGLYRAWLEHVTGAFGDRRTEVRGRVFGSSGPGASADRDAPEH